MQTECCEAARNLLLGTRTINKHDGSKAIAELKENDPNTFWIITYAAEELRKTLSNLENIPDYSLAFSIASALGRLEGVGFTA